MYAKNLYLLVWEWLLRFTALSFANREDLIFDSMDVDNPEVTPVDDEWEDEDLENAGLYTLPPGEEGIVHSHAGGESIFQQVVDGINPQYVISFLFYPFFFDLYYM